VGRIELPLAVLLLGGGVLDLISEQRAGLLRGLRVDRLGLALRVAPPALCFG
jgi:hypothetical protein